MFFAVVDLIEMSSKMILAGPSEEEIVSSSFKGRLLEPGLYDLGPLVSRKKDFIPPLSRYFKTD